MLSRTTRTPRLHTAIRRSQLALLNLLGHVDRAIDPVGCCDSAHRLVSARSGRLGFASRILSTRGLPSGVSCTQERGVHWCRNSISRTFYSVSVHFERNGSASERQASSSSGSLAVQSSHLPSSLLADDFRSLILSRKREVAILEAALEILETAPRDKRFEDLVRKHNIQLEPFKVLVTQPEKWKDPGSLSMLEAHSPKPVLGDLVAESDIEFKSASAVEPTSQIGSFSKVKKSFIEDDFVDLEPAKSSDSQQDRRWNTTQLSSSKVDSTMFDKLSFDDFPSPQDPNFERLQKKRRRQELMKEHERNSRIESLNFGVAAKNVSNPIEESPVDSLRPNASAFLEQTDQKPRRSLADRLYEEQFGRPAPPGLKRTYPKGSFYDRCMKEKEQKERDAAAAATRVASSPSPSRSVPSSLSRSTESTASVSLQWAEAGDNSIRKNVISNDTNQEKKPGAWKCPEYES